MNGSFSSPFGRAFSGKVLKRVLELCTDPLYIYIYKFHTDQMCVDGHSSSLPRDFSV